MKKPSLLILAIGAFFIFATLAFLIRDTIRETIVVPLYYMAWLSGVIYDSLPQRVVWGLLVVGGIYLAARSIATPYRFDEEEEEQDMSYRGRVEVWTRWIDLANQGSLFRLKLGRELEDLTVNTLAYQHQLSVEDIRHQIRQGKIELSKEYKSMIQNERGLESITMIQKLINRFRPVGRDSSLEAKIEGIVKFLEDELEVHGDENGS